MSRNGPRVEDGVEGEGRGDEDHPDDDHDEGQLGVNEIQTSFLKLIRLKKKNIYQYINFACSYLLCPRSMQHVYYQIALQCCGS